MYINMVRKKETQNQISIFFKYKIKTFLAAKETARQRESDREKRNLRYLQVAQLRRSAHERFPNQRQKAVEISWESQLP